MQRKLDWLFNLIVNEIAKRNWNTHHSFLSFQFYFFRSPAECTKGKWEWKCKRNSKERKKKLLTQRSVRRATSKGFAPAPAMYFSFKSDFFVLNCVPKGELALSVDYGVIWLVLISRRNYWLLTQRQAKKSAPVNAKGFWGITRVK